jgi:hypothetical protein
LPKAQFFGQSKNFSKITKSKKEGKTEKEKLRIKLTTDLTQTDQRTGLW